MNYYLLKETEFMKFIDSFEHELIKQEFLVIFEKICNTVGREKEFSLINPVGSESRRSIPPTGEHCKASR